MLLIVLMGKWLKANIDYHPVSPSPPPDVSIIKQWGHNSSQKAAYNYVTLEPLLLAVAQNNGGRMLVFSGVMPIRLSSFSDKHSILQPWG